MSDRTFDFSTLLDTYSDAFAPVLRAQTEGFRTLERLARYQFAVAGDYLDWSLAQASASVQTKSVADLVSQQTELNTRLGEKLRTRAEELTQIATETQSVVTQWIDATAAKATDSVKKAA